VDKVCVHRNTCVRDEEDPSRTGIRNIRPTTVILLSVLLLLVVLFVLRPVTVWLSTIRAPIDKKDRWLLAWIAPRGIAAAATAGIFGSELQSAGCPGAELLLPVIFSVILHRFGAD